MKRYPALFDPRKVFEPPNQDDSDPDTEERPSVCYRRPLLLRGVRLKSNSLFGRVKDILGYIGARYAVCFEKHDRQKANPARPRYKLLTGQAPEFFAANTKR